MGPLYNEKLYVLVCEDVNIGTLCKMRDNNELTTAPFQRRSRGNRNILPVSSQLYRKRDEDESDLLTSEKRDPTWRCEG